MTSTALPWRISMQESQARRRARASAAPRLPICGAAVQRLARMRAMVVLPMPRWPGKDIAVRDTVLRQRVHQRARDVVLAGHVGKTLRAIFPGQNLITHGKKCSFVAADFETAQVRLYRSGVARMVR